MDKSENIIGINIIIKRGELGLTQEELAAEIGVDQKYISRWERGVKPTAEYLNVLAKALGVTVEQLINGHKPEEFSPIQKALIKNLVEEVLIIREHRYSSGPPTQIAEDICLEFPKMYEGLTRHESYQWNMNELALRRWAETKWAFNAPAWTLEKFCREVEAFEDGSRLQDITGILKGFIEEEPTEKKS